MNPRQGKVPVRVKRTQPSWARRGARALREPTIHFFMIAAAILLLHRLVVGSPRTIVITPTLKADLQRRLQDQLSRPPTSAEVDARLRWWKQEEALYREALREGIDRDDLTVRNVLISKMRERAMLQTRIPEPTEFDLQEYLAQHREQFEAPPTYEHEYVGFPKTGSGTDENFEAYARKLTAGATPASLGLRSVAAIVNRERIEQEFGPETADRIVHLPIGQWTRLEAPNQRLLVRMIRIEGGLPAATVLHERLVGAWKGAEEQKALDRATQAIANRYRFQEPRD